jgi:hypothetical protein
MENICRDFSRRTINVKISFIIHDENTSRAVNLRRTTSHKYSLDVVKLSPVPESVRNAGASYVAEIPPRYFFQDQKAEYVGLACEDEEEYVNNSNGNTSATVIAAVPVQIITDREEYHANPTVLAAEATALPVFINQVEHPQQHSCNHYPQMALCQVTIVSMDN